MFAGFGVDGQKERTVPRNATTWIAIAIAVIAGVAIGIAVGYAVRGEDGQEPTAAGGGAAAAGARCGGTDIVFFPGGPPGGVFAVNVFKGAQAAERDLGANVRYVWSNWDPERMVSQFKDALGQKPDGIAVMGHPGDDPLSSLIDQAVEQGIIVTSQNTELPKNEGKYKAGGFGYVGQDLYDSGFALGQEAIKRAGLKAGDRAMVWGLKSQPTRGLRTKGAEDALKRGGLTVDYIEINQATNADPAAGTPVFSSYVSENPDVKVVVTDHGGLTATVETYMNAANKGADEIYVAGFDLSDATLEAIKGGWTDLVLDQQPWLQGYLPILQICLTKRYQFAGLHIDTGSGFVDKDNVGELEPLVKQAIR
jgi:simple sugar transport system substrate-binding protein